MLFCPFVGEDESVCVTKQGKIVRSDSLYT